TIDAQFQGNVPPAPLSGTPLTLGSTVNDTIAVAGQQVQYTFTLAAGALLYFDALTNDSNLSWSLAGPAGTAVNGRNFTGSDGLSAPGDPVLSLPAGAYTLT